MGASGVQPDSDQRQSLRRGQYPVGQSGLLHAFSRRCGHIGNAPRTVPAQQIEKLAFRLLRYTVNGGKILLVQLMPSYLLR